MYDKYLKQNKILRQDNYYIVLNARIYRVYNYQKSQRISISIFKSNLSG